MDLLVVYVIFYEKNQDRYRGSPPPPDIKPQFELKACWLTVCNCSWLWMQMRTTHLLVAFFHSPGLVLCLTLKLICKTKHFFSKSKIYPEKLFTLCSSAGLTQGYFWSLWLKQSKIQIVLGTCPQLGPVLWLLSKVVVKCITPSFMTFLSQGCQANHCLC